MAPAQNRACCVCPPPHTHTHPPLVARTLITHPLDDDVLPSLQDQGELIDDEAPVRQTARHVVDAHQLLPQAE